MIFNGKPLSLPMAENRLNYGKKISYMGCTQSKALFHNLKKKK